MPTSLIPASGGLRRAGGLLAAALLSVSLSGCTMATNLLGSIGRPSAPAAQNQTSPEEGARAVIGDPQGRYTRPSITGLTSLSLGDIDGVLVESQAVRTELATQFAQMKLKVDRSETVVGMKGGCAAMREALSKAGWRREIGQAQGGDETGVMLRQGTQLTYALRAAGQSCVMVAAATSPQ